MRRTKDQPAWNVDCQLVLDLHVKVRAETATEAIHKAKHMARRRFKQKGRGQWRLWGASNVPPYGDDGLRVM